MKNIKNFVQLTESIATSGQPTEEQFAMISKVGYEVVVNLAMPDHVESIGSEGRLVTEAGMAYFHIPVPFDHPTAEHIRLFCNVMRALKGKKVWVHCIMNYRVALFMFHYLNKVEGLSDSASMSPIFKSWQPNETWQKLLSLTSEEIGL